MAKKYHTSWLEIDPEDFAKGDLSAGHLVTYSHDEILSNREAFNKESKELGCGEKLELVVPSTYFSNRCFRVINKEGRTQSIILFVTLLSTELEEVRKVLKNERRYHS